MIDYLNKCLFVGLFIAVVGMAIPFGGVDLWVQMIFSFILACLLVAWSGIAIISSPKAIFLPQKIGWPIFLFAVVCFWAAFQILPFSPVSWHHPIWTETATIMEPQIVGRISINPEASLEGLIILSAYAITFWLALQLGRDPRRAKFCLQFFIFSSAILALYGLFSLFTGDQKILWADKRFYMGSLTGTFVNRNAFATYLGMGLICSVAYIIDRFDSVTSSTYSYSRTILKGIEGLADSIALYLGSALLILTALLLTQSRAGIISSFIGLGALLISTNRAYKSRGISKVLVATFVAAIVGFIFSVSGAGISQRLNRLGTFELGERAVIYDVTIRAIQEKPILGTGLNTYREAIYPYLSPAMSTKYSVFDAHNTYLESALELGMPASLALLASIGLLVVMCWQGLGSRHQCRHYSPIAIAISILIATHALLDFSVEIPAVAAAFALLLGIGVAQSTSTKSLRKP